MIRLRKKESGIGVKEYKEFLDILQFTTYLATINHIEYSRECSGGRNFSHFLTINDCVLKLPNMIFCCKNLLRRPAE